MANFSEGILQAPAPYERIVLNNWNLSSSKVLYYTPQKGRRITGVSLGWSDQSGGVRLSSPDLPGATDVLVGPGAGGFVGNITGPFQVFPFVRVSGIAENASPFGHTLDLLVWYDCLPPGFPQRGPYQITDTLTSAAAVVAPVAGRKRITVAGAAAAAATPTITIVPIFPIATAGYFTPPLFSRATAAGGTFQYEFDAANVPASNAADRVPTQMWGVQVSSSTADLVGLSIEARDY